MIAVAFAAAGAGNLLGAALRHGNGSWAFGARGFGEIALVQLTRLVQGMAVGMALLITAAAIVLYYVVPNRDDLDRRPAQPGRAAGRAHRGQVQLITLGEPPCCRHVA